MENKIENGTLKILTTNGWKIHKARQTEIIEVYNWDNFCIVRESYMNFKGSNVYAIDYNLNILWEAELPHPSDVFANILIEKENGFETTTWNGIFCRINPQTGRITKLGIQK